MLRKHLSLLALSLGMLCLAGNMAASTLTSSNGLDVLAYSGGTTPSIFTDWANALTGGILGEGNGFTNITSFTAGGTFQVTGATLSGVNYQGSPSFPMVVTMPNLATFTGLALQLTGNLAVTVNLSDGSSATTGSLNLASPNLITFASPLRIVSVEIDATSDETFTLSDVVWGTADPSKLPAQPAPGPGDSGDQSAVPEVSTLLLMGGGLFGLSRLTKKRNHLLGF
jgi:hypothetical protein